MNLDSAQLIQFAFDSVSPPPRAMQCCASNYVGWQTNQKNNSKSCPAQPVRMGKLFMAALPLRKAQGIIKVARVSLLPHQSNRQLWVTGASWGHPSGCTGHFAVPSPPCLPPCGWWESTIRSNSFRCLPACSHSHIYCHSRWAEALI